MIEILNICLHQNSILIKFLKILKIHEIFCENPRIIFVLFYDVHKKNMFTINLEDGREAPSKASNVNGGKTIFILIGTVFLPQTLILLITTFATRCRKYLIFPTLELC